MADERQDSTRGRDRDGRLKAAATSRDARLKAALKANIARRKARAQALDDTPGDPATSPDGTRSPIPRPAGDPSPDPQKD